MNTRKKIIIFCLLTFVPLSGCGGTICKGEKKSIVFDYDPIFQTVDIGGMPTHFKGKNAPWVKKIIVKSKGFLVVTEQKTAGYKEVPCKDKNKKGQKCQKHYISSYYQMDYYTDEEGYKYWGNISKKEWESISQLEDQPAKKPDLHIKNCKFSLFGSLLELILALFRA